MQQVRGSLGAHDQRLIITTSDFSKGARTETAQATKTPLALMNGEELVGCNYFISDQILALWYGGVPDQPAGLGIRTLHGNPRRPAEPTGASGLSRHP